MTDPEKDPLALALPEGVAEFEEVVVEEADALPLVLSFVESVSEEEELRLGEEDTLSLILREAVVVSVALVLQEEDGELVGEAEADPL